MIKYALIILVAVFDAGFALAFQDTFQEWEANPIARFLAQCFGVPGVCGIRILTAVFCCLYFALSSAKQIYTDILVTVSALLMFWYSFLFAMNHATNLP